MVSKIKELERNIWAKLSTVNDIAFRQQLHNIHKAAEQQYKSIQLSLSVAKEQLLVSTQHKDISSQQLDEIRAIKHVLPSRFADLC